ncbi:MAG: hypothetical protein ABIV48_08350 [Pyrinomonadaceae bacterium]
MQNKGFIRRVFPFLTAFAVGLFITSFFVDLSRPSFRGRGFGKRSQEIRRLRMENEQQQQVINRLRNELENHHRPPAEMFHDHDEWMNRGPEFPVEGPPPPMVVVPKVRHR